MWYFPFKAPTTKADPKSFVYGTVIHWSNGVRATIIDKDVLTDQVLVRELDGKENWFSGNYVENNAWPTDVQPGQKYQSPNRVWVVVRLKDSTDWWCRIDGLPAVHGGDGKLYRLRESELLGWPRIDGLNGAPAAPTHGPHICPRCGSAGALVLLNDVACVNKICTRYQAVDLHYPKPKCLLCGQMFWTINNKFHACRKAKLRSIP